MEFKLDKNTADSANAHLRNMSNVLNEIATTYSILLDVIAQQEAGIRAPGLDNFRQQLKRNVIDGVVLAQKITLGSAELVKIGEQTTQQLTSIASKTASTKTAKKVDVV